MALSVDVTNLAEIEKYIDDMPDETYKDARTVFAKAVLSADATVAANFGSRLNSRTNALRKSIRTSVSGNSLSTLRASIFGARYADGKQLVYTLTQEYGATIKAKKAYRNVPGGPYLNIPTSSNKTPAGVTRLTPKTVFQQGGHIHKTASGKWGVFLGGQMKFVLVKKVEIPARLGMRDAAADEVPTILSRLQNLIGE